MPKIIQALRETGVKGYPLWWERRMPGQVLNDDDSEPNAVGQHNHPGVVSESDVNIMKAASGLCTDSMNVNTSTAAVTAVGPSTQGMLLRHRRDMVAGFFSQHLYAQV
ncbi:hypothetical protein ANO14919_094550 [Xylariales sp. No.14919]|nr:hypothetical protein ANO14919_094550 [Xylariales sp. No.14919]